MAGRDRCGMNHQIGRLKVRVVAVNVTTPLLAPISDMFIDPRDQPPACVTTSV
jgi:hypothetical protein